MELSSSSIRDGNRIKKPDLRGNKRRREKSQVRITCGWPQSDRLGRDKKADLKRRVKEYLNYLLDFEYPQGYSHRWNIELFSVIDWAKYLSSCCRGMMAENPFIRQNWIQKENQTKFIQHWWLLLQALFQPYAIHSMSHWDLGLLEQC